MRMMSSMLSRLMSAQQPLNRRRLAARHDAIVLIGEQVEPLAQAYLAQNTNLPVYCITPQPQPSEQRLQQVVYLHADATHPDAVLAALGQIKQHGHRASLVIFQPAAPLEQQTLSVSATSMIEQWQHSVRRLFLWTQGLITESLLGAERPLTVLVVGSSLAQRPTTPYSASSALFAGMRALAQSVSREFQPQGLHMVYMGLSEQPEPDALARLCWQLHVQPHSAWTQEIDTIKSACSI